MFELFRFIKCLLNIAYRDEPNAGFFSSLATDGIALCIVYPIVLSLEHYGYIEPLSSVSPQFVHMLQSPRLRYIPSFILNVMFFGPVVFLFYHSPAGAEAQREYNRTHMRAIEKNFVFLRRLTAALITILMTGVALLAKLGFMYVVAAMVVLVASSAWALRKFIPAVEPGTQ